MQTKNEILAHEYYTLMGQKNAVGIKKYLHPDVALYSPMATVKGKEAVYQSACNFIEMIHSLKVRAGFGAGDQAMIVSDSLIPGMKDLFPTASLLSFRDELIIKIELFYDSRPLF